MIFYLVGGSKLETQWVFNQIFSFAISQGPHKKPRFQYQLPVVGNVCRRNWILCAGYPNPNNSRVRATEALIRKGAKCPPPGKTRIVTASVMTLYAAAFMVEYIKKHSQCSPSDKILYVDFCGLRQLYALYRRECKGRRILAQSSFANEWNKVLCKGVVDSETSVQYVVHIRRGRAKGFKKCDKCQYLKMRIIGAATSLKREARQRQLEEHMSDINSDREALARIQRLCITDESHAGFYMDAADSAKFSIPTTR